MTDTLLSIHHTAYVKRIDDNLRNDPKSFRTYVNNKRSTSRIPGLIVYNEVSYYDPVQIANVFSEIFFSVFCSSALDNTIYASALHHTYDNTFPESIIDPTQLAKILKEFPSELTSGLDSMPSILALNPKKCNVMSFYESNYTAFAYSINGTELERVSHKKDLGVTFDRQLNFKLQIENIISELNRMLGFIIRLGRTIRSLPALKALFFRIRAIET